VVRIKTSQLALQPSEEKVPICRYAKLNLTTAKNDVNTQLCNDSMMCMLQLCCAGAELCNDKLLWLDGKTAEQHYTRAR